MGFPGGTGPVKNLHVQGDIKRCEFDHKIRRPWGRSDNPPGLVVGNPTDRGA